MELDRQQLLCVLCKSGHLIIKTNLTVIISFFSEDTETQRDYETCKMTPN